MAEICKTSNDGTLSTDMIGRSLSVPMLHGESSAKMDTMMCGDPQTLKGLKMMMMASQIVAHRPRAYHDQMSLSK